MPKEDMNKFTPKSKINKSHLTPVRRVGLPRKRKQTSSLLNSSNTSDTTISDLDNSINNTSISGNCSEKKIKKSNDSFNELKDNPIILNESQKEINENILIENNFINDNKKEVKEYKNKRIINKSTKNIKDKLSKLDYIIEITEKNDSDKEDKLKIINDNEDIFKAQTLEFTNNENMLMKASNYIENTLTEKHQPKPYFRRCLSMKKSPPRDDSKEIKSELLPELTKLSKVEVLQHSYASNEQIETLKKLEKTVKEKSEYLDSLKRAEIYRNLHDVKEIDEITKWWKKNCITALNDLLPQMKNYGNINMNDLLIKLNIPSHIIALDSNGQLN